MTAAVLVVLVGLTYCNVGDQFTLFDALFVRDNPDLKSLWALRRAMSLHLVGADAVGDSMSAVRRPVESLSFALNHVLLGSEAVWFRLVNLAIHVFCGLLLFGVLRQTLDMPRLGYSERRAHAMSAAVAALWLIHPVNSDVVNFVSQRSTSLMSLFFLLSIYAAIRSWERATCSQDSAAAPPRSATWRWVVLSIVAAALAMGTKESAVSLPIVIWLYDATFVCSSFREPLQKRWRFYLLLACTWAVLGALVGVTIEDVGTDLHPSDISYYLPRQPTVIVEYLRRSVWPGRIYSYAWQVDGRSLDPSLVNSAAIGALLLAAAAGMLRRHPAGFAGAWFFLLLAPTSSVMALDETIQLNRMYLPLAAVLAVGAVALVAVLERLRRYLVVPVVAGTIVLALTAVFAHATHERNEDFHSELAPFKAIERIFITTLSGKYAFLHSDFLRARGYFERALDYVGPDCDDEAFITPKLRGLGVVHRCRILNALGVIHWTQGEVEEADTMFRRALGERRSAVAANNLGVVLWLQGDPEEARNYFQLSRSMKPEQGAAQHNLDVLSRLFPARPEPSAAGVEVGSERGPEGARVVVGQLDSNSPDDYALLLSDDAQHEGRVGGS